MSLLEWVRNRIYNFIETLWLWWFLFPILIGSFAAHRLKILWLIIDGHLTLEKHMLIIHTLHCGPLRTSVHQVENVCIDIVLSVLDSWEGAWQVHKLLLALVVPIFYMAAVDWDIMRFWFESFGVSPPNGSKLFSIISINKLGVVRLWTLIIPLNRIRLHRIYLFHVLLHTILIHWLYFLLQFTFRNGCLNEAEGIISWIIDGFVCTLKLCALCKANILRLLKQCLLVPLIFPPAEGAEALPIPRMDAIIHAVVYVCSAV